jgi:hypothetical protein
VDAEETSNATCRQCRQFIDDPGAVEKEFPGIKILGSAYASVRGSAGVCRAFDRFMDPIPAAECPSFRSKDE